jgi:hypothetical protein
MALRNIQRNQTARVFHQVLHAASATHRKKSPLFRVLRFDPAAPQRVAHATRLNDYRVGQHFVIGLGLAQVRQQLPPARSARAVLSDAVKGRRNHLLSGVGGE